MQQPLDDKKTPLMESKDMPTYLDNTDTLAPTTSAESVFPKPKLTVHRLVVILLVSLAIALMLVWSLDAMFSNNELHGRSNHYYCPNTNGEQVTICFKT
ncbi:MULTISPECIES: hypothetical protein [unclassified Moraxella]|uniref:hypothetical protein n=1 Tax=unclassified Moraxella TaxID=2685852 RepID=UPI003AF69821